MIRLRIESLAWVVGWDHAGASTPLEGRPSVATSSMSLKVSAPFQGVPESRCTCDMRLVREHAVLGTGRGAGGR